MINPMDQIVALRLENIRGAPRCGARTRSGSACQSPALRGRRRCRLHGGRSTGSHGAANGHFVDGYWTKSAIAEREWLRGLINECTKK